ncbi:MAG: helix-turn-helix transcriptional regulator [Acidobacteria bacterium]|nr:helix-turn-helix transcriptional regulator [Acidobacteriota bacterium]
MNELETAKFKLDGSKLRPYLTKSVTQHAKDLGISRVHFSSILSGKKTPSTDLAMTICVTLGVPIEEIAVKA